MEPGETLSTSTEQKVYFGDSKYDARMNENGWAIAGDTIKNDEIVSFQKPEGTDVVPIEPDNFPIGTVHNYLVYDPEKAETKIVRWHQKGNTDLARALEGMGWKQVDTNVARGIYVRTKPPQSRLK